MNAAGAPRSQLHISQSKRTSASWPESANVTESSSMPLVHSLPVLRRREIADTEIRRDAAAFDIENSVENVDEIRVDRLTVLLY